MVITKYFKFSESPLHQINNHLHTSLVRIKQTYRQQEDIPKNRQIDRQMMVGGRSYKQRNYLFLESFIYLTLHIIVSVTQSMYTSSHQLYEWLDLTWHDSTRISNGKSKPWKSLFFSLNKYYGTFSQKVNLKLLINNKCICCGDNSKDITVSKYSLSNPICEYAIYGVNEIIDRRLRTIYIHLLLKRKQETGLSVICWDSDVQV